MAAVLAAARSGGVRLAVLRLPASYGVRELTRKIIRPQSAMPVGPRFPQRWNIHAISLMVECQPKCWVAHQPLTRLTPIYERERRVAP